MNDPLRNLLDMIKANDGINDKARLARIVADAFRLTKDRSVYYCGDFAVRFSSSGSRNFGNTVLSLSNLRKYDDRPFIVCLVTPGANYCLLANTTFLKKVSHSSQELRENNIRGSFNGSDIAREFEGISNTPKNISRLFDIHAEIGFEGNLARLVEATNNISPTGTKFLVSDSAAPVILAAPKRAEQFIESQDHAVLKAELDAQVNKFKSEILLAALIENVNVRGRIIEYLIAGEDETLRQELVIALKAGDKGIPKFRTDNALGDYQRRFDAFDTETDVKTKIMILNSNPKAYNLDKVLEFLASERSVFMFYFVGITPGKIVDTVLVSMFQRSNQTLHLTGAALRFRATSSSFSAGPKGADRSAPADEVSGHQHPGIDGQRPRSRQGRQAAHEILPVGVILKDASALQSPRHHMGQHVRRI